MKKIKILLVVICSLLLMSFIFNSIPELNYRITNKLTEYTKNEYPEKIYVQTDKPYYIAGEDLWFNAFLVNGVTHRKSNKSKVVYIELINKNDSVIAERQLFTESISTHGDFKLPIDLKQGKYLLRAYTNYMRNQDNDFFFKKEIPVFSIGESDSLNLNTLNPPRLNSKTPQQNKPQPNLGFYPEGGYLVEGINNKVAIKVKNQNQLETNVMGFIEDDQGNRVTDFKTFEFGLGVFFLKPEPNKRYKAVITNNGTEVEYPLPNPLSKGYVMTTAINKDELLIELTTNLKKGLKNTFIVGHQRGLVAFDRFQEKSTNNILLNIPKDNFTNGVLSITLFNEEEKPIAERLIYIHSDKETVDISVKKNKENIGVRDKVNLNIEVKNILGDVIPSTLSIAVRDAETIPQQENAETIETWLLLNSDLRGKIESPGYFFKNKNKVKREYLLDLIMLTHGWTRFTWQELLQENTIPNYKAEKGLYIEGITVSSKPPYRQRPAETRLTFKREALYQEIKETNQNGAFSYGPFVYHDSINILLEASNDRFKDNEVVDHTKVGIKLTNSNDKPTINHNLSIRTPLKKDIKYNDHLKKQAKAVTESYYQFDEGRELLDEVFLEKKVESKKEKEEAQRNKRTRYFSPNHRVVVDDLGVTGSRNFLHLLLNIPGVKVLSLTANSFDENVPSSTPITVRDGVPSFYLNGRKVPFDILASIPPAEIEFIDVLTPPNTLNFALEAHAAIVVYTKKGRSFNAKAEKKPGSINFNSLGFYTAREFFSPDYASGFINSGRKDIRSTIYWQPKVETSKKKNGLVSFYTSDQKGTYIVEVEGMTTVGVPVHSLTTFEVQ